MQFLLLSLLADANVSALENLGAQTCLGKVFSSFCPTPCSCCIIFRNHLANKLVQLKSFPFSPLLCIINVFEIVQIHTIHFKVC